MQTDIAAAATPPATEAPQPPRRCSNCQEPAPGQYCPHCGQATDTAPRSIAALLHAWLRGSMGRDGRITRTMRMLLLVPGGLTADYLAGRRARHLRPLQLYLAVSLAVFASVQFLDLDLVLRVAGSQGPHVLRSTRLPPGATPGPWSPPELIARHLHTPGVERFAALSVAEKFAFLRARRARLLSSLLLVLVPAFAFVLAACFRPQRRFFVEHLVFALHAQAFALLALLAGSLLPVAPANVLGWWTVAYVLLALRRVYATGWRETLLRGTAALAGYGVLFYLSNLLLVALLVSL